MIRLNRKSSLIGGAETVPFVSLSVLANKIYIYRWNRKGIPFVICSKKMQPKSGVNTSKKAKSFDLRFMIIYYPRDFRESE